MRGRIWKEVGEDFKDKFMIFLIFVLVYLYIDVTFIFIVKEWE